MSWFLNLFGRKSSGMADDFADVTLVGKISATTLGKEIIRRCGNEGQCDSNTHAQSLIRNFLQAGITFLPDVEKAGVDMSKVTFIMALPGSEFVLKSGSEWEFLFTLDSQDSIVVSCTSGRLKCSLPNRKYSIAARKRGNSHKGKRLCLTFTEE